VISLGSGADCKGFATIQLSKNLILRIYFAATVLSVTVVGYVVTCPSPETFALKLQEADRIEEYDPNNPSGYLRSIVTVM
jgi:hypothetical protein